MLSLRTGDGQPGGEFGGNYDYVEQSVYEMAVTMHENLEAFGIDHVWDYYGPGAHTWPYWQRDLRLEAPAIMATFADPPRKPRRFSFRAIDPAYGVHGFDVRIDRPALEFSRLAVAGPRRFSLDGSGSAVVRTARRYEPGEDYEVTVDGPADSATKLEASGRGRLRISLDLGPGNPHQQYTDEADAAGGTQVRTATVAISPG